MKKYKDLYIVGMNSGFYATRYAASYCLRFYLIEDEGIQCGTGLHMVKLNDEWYSINESSWNGVYYDKCNKFYDFLGCDMVNNAEYKLTPVYVDKEVGDGEYLENFELIGYQIN